MRYWIENSKIVAHSYNFVLCISFVSRLDLDRQELARAHVLDRFESVFVNEITNYRFAFGIASLRLV
jgi:hypothetical protein